MKFLFEKPSSFLKAASVYLVGTVSILSGRACIFFLEEGLAMDVVILFWL